MSTFQFFVLLGLFFIIVVAERIVGILNGASKKLDIATISTHLRSIEDVLGGIANDVSTIDSNIATISTHLGSIEDVLGGIANDVSTIDSNIATISTHLGSIEGMLGGIANDVSTIDSNIESTMPDSDNFDAGA